MKYFFSGQRSTSWSGLLLFSFIILQMSVSSVATAHEKQWPEKRLRQVWTDAQKFTSRQMTLTSDQIAKLTENKIDTRAEDRSPTFYLAQSEDANSRQTKTIGVILFVDGYGANGKIEISVAMEPDGQVKKVDIWDHAEGGAVAKADFLNQFIGKTSKDSFVENKDYKPAPDALKASQAIARGIEKALKITNLVFQKK